MIKEYIEPIAKIYTDFEENFGVPRQSGLAEGLKGEIVFYERFRTEHGVRGLEEFSHIWVLWRFDREGAEKKDRWKPTVRPPRLGGNTRVGVFATRSPFRPNGIALSCVKLDNVYIDEKRGPVLSVSGIDMRNGTEIYDIKPYLPHIDAHPEAKGGFAQDAAYHRLVVDFPENLLKILPESRRKGAVQMLAQDPRPGYQDEPERIYGVAFAGYDIRFQVEDKNLKVIAVDLRNSLA